MRPLLACMTLTLIPLAIGAGAGTAAGQEPPEPDTAGFVGTWMGTLDAGAAQLRLRFVIAETEGVPGATLYSVDQGNAQIQVAETTVSSDTISMSMPMIGASFRGTLSEEEGQITGTFTQAGQSFELVLERVPEDEGAVTLRRPQNPEEPYPYLAEDVAYANPEGGHTLAGTFTRPAFGGPFPAVILISGSGPQDRDEALMGHRPFLVLADHLTRRGIAVLRYDDRGVGESTGDFGTATSQDFASDALAAVAYLKTRDDVDPGKIGLAGHSEGGIIAPMAAVASRDVSYIVLMAATGVNGERILYAQAALIARAAGAPEEAIAANREQQRAIFDVLKREPDPGRAGEKITAIIRAGLERANAGGETAGDDAMRQAVAAQVRQVNNPWFRYFLTYEPAPMLERVTVPVLAINGEKDLQVPYQENLREIEAALRRGGNTRYETHALPDLNHLFQHAQTGSPSEYQSIEETWSVEAMELIADWILKTAGGQPRYRFSEFLFCQPHDIKDGGLSVLWEKGSRLDGLLGRSVLAPVEEKPSDFTHFPLSGVVETP